MQKISDFKEYYEFVYDYLSNHSLASLGWNSKVADFLKEPEVKEFFEKKIFERNPLIPHLQQLIYLALLNVIDDHEEMEEIQVHLAQFEEALKELHPDVEGQPLKSLTMLDMTLAIACLRRQILHPELNMNFEMVFNEYHKFASRKCSMLDFDRHVMIKCWENLIHLEILRPLDQGSRVLNEYRSYALNVMPEEIQNVVKNHDRLMRVVQDWANCSANE